MAFESEKTMFEVYREKIYGSKFRVVYFTELNDHNKGPEINRAMAGEHFVDGFIRDLKKEEAKARIDEILERMNSGEELSPDDFEKEMTGYLA